MAAFKMSGSGVLSYWDNPEANRVMAALVTDPSSARELPVTGLWILMHMAYDPGTRRVLLTKQGPGRHSIDLLDVSGFPTMTVVRTAALAFPPHEVVKHPSDASYGVFGQHGEFLLVSADGPRCM
jgi:hypothetical protein